MEQPNPHRTSTSSSLNDGKNGNFKSENLPVPNSIASPEKNNSSTAKDHVLSLVGSFKRLSIQDEITSMGNDQALNSTYAQDEITSTGNNTQAQNDDQIPDDELVKMLDEAFASYLSNDKSLKRLDTTPSLIPRSFSPPSATPDCAINKISLAFRQSNSGIDVKENAVSEVHFSSSLAENVENLEFQSSGRNLLESSSSQRNTANEVLQPKSSPPFLGNYDVKERSQIGFSKVSNDDNDSILHDKSQFPEVSASSLSEQRRKMEVVQPPRQTSSNSSSLPATGSNTGSMEDSGNGENYNVETGILKRHPLSAEHVFAKKANPSQTSVQINLREIGSFHHDFVGKLPLLSTPYSNTGVSYDTHSGNNTNHNPNPEEGTSSETQNPQGPSAETETPTLQGIVIDPTQNENKIRDEQSEAEAMVEAVENRECEKNTESSLTKSSGAASLDELVKRIAKNYLDFLENEWQKRREIWKEDNKHNPNPKSLYMYPTFRDGISSGKIPLQVPFSLPSVEKKKVRNPTLKDSTQVQLNEGECENDIVKKTEKAEQCREKEKQSKSNIQARAVDTKDESRQEILPKTEIATSFATVVATPVNKEFIEIPSVLLQNALTKEIESEGNTVKDTTSTEDVTPLDLTPFLDECRGLWENLGSSEAQPFGCSSLWGALFNATRACSQKQLGSEEESKRDGSATKLKSKTDVAQNSNDNIPSISQETDNENPRTKKAESNTNSSNVQKSRESIKTPRSSASKIRSRSDVRQLARLSCKGSGKSPTGKKSSLPVSNRKSSGKNLKGKIPVKVVKKQKVSTPESKKFTDVDPNGQKGKMQVKFVEDMNDGIDDGANETAINDLDTSGPLVEELEEIYRGLERENTITNIKSNDWVEEYFAFVNGRKVRCDSLRQKTRLDMCCMKLNNIQYYPANLRDLTLPPGASILGYLTLTDFMNCRLVSRKWNNAVISSKKFLSTTTFTVRQKPLGALATLESSSVRWQNIRCSVMPGINFSASSYNGRFLSSNLRVLPASSRKEPLTNTLTTAIFENFDIHKQQLVQWIGNCKRLAVIEVRNCNFLRTTVSMNMDKINRVMEKIQVMKFSDMDSVKLAEALRFFIPATRHLHSLEVRQKRIGKQKSVTYTARKGAEDDVAAVLCPALKRNAKTLKSIVFELISEKNCSLQSRIVETLGSEIFQLSRLIIRSFSPGCSQPCLKFDSYGSPKHMTRLLQTTLRNSTKMTLLDFPMLTIDFVSGMEGAWLLPCKLEKLSAQLEMPEQQAFRTQVEFPFLRELDLYGTSLEDFQWYHVNQTMKGLTQLVVHCTGIRDSHLQAIIKNLKSLQVLRLENVQDVTDFGITGMEKSWIERLRMYWPENIESTYEQFQRDRIGFIGKSLTSLDALRTFTMKGNFSLSNVSILFGFNSRELTTLELSGSPVNASNSGLFILGFQCSRLRRLLMSVQHSKVNQSGIRSLYESLTDRNPSMFQVELLPCEELEESEPKLPMIGAHRL